MPIKENEGVVPNCPISTLFSVFVRVPDAVWPTWNPLTKKVIFVPSVIPVKIPVSGNVWDEIILSADPSNDL